MNKKTDRKQQNNSRAMAIHNRLHLSRREMDKIAREMGRAADKERERANIEKSAEVWKDIFRRESELRCSLAELFDPETREVLYRQPLSSLKKIPESEINEVIRMSSDGIPQLTISNITGLHRSTVYYLLKKHRLDKEKRCGAV